MIMLKPRYCLSSNFFEGERGWGGEGVKDREKSADRQTGRQRNRCISKHFCLHIAILKTRQKGLGDTIHW